MTAENMDRRKLIQRAVAAGGIVWAAPVIESMVHGVGAAGTPKPTTTTEEPTTTTSTSTSTTSTSTTTTTTPEPCDSTICAKAAVPGGTIYFVGTPTNAEDRDCLCKCADPNFVGTCSQADPCDYPVTFTQCPTVNVCCCPPDLCS